jgi:hypothetical protein
MSPAIGTCSLVRFCPGGVGSPQVTRMTSPRCPAVRPGTGRVAVSAFPSRRWWRRTLVRKGCSTPGCSTRMRAYFYRLRTMRSIFDVRSRQGRTVAVATARRRSGASTAAGHQQAGSGRARGAGQIEHSFRCITSPPARGAVRLGRSHGRAPSAAAVPAGPWHVAGTSASLLAEVWIAPVTGSQLGCTVAAPALHRDARRGAHKVKRSLPSRVVHAQQPAAVKSRSEEG